MDPPLPAPPAPVAKAAAPMPASGADATWLHYAGQQESLAFGEIVGKKVCSVHVAEYCSNSCEQEKPCSSFFFN